MLSRTVPHVTGAVVVLLMGATGLMAQAPAAGASVAAFFPPSTRAWIATPNAEQSRAAFLQTQLGHLTQDPAMKPFMEDLKAQLADRLSEIRGRLGLTWDDVWNAQDGALASAAMELNDEQQPYAFALLVQTGSKQAMQKELVAKIAQSMAQQQAAAEQSRYQGTGITTYTLPRARGERVVHRISLVVLDGWVVATSHPVAAQLIVQCMRDPAAASLAQSEAFQAIDQRVRSEAGEGPIHVQWFLDPFGYVRIMRAADPSLRREGRNWLEHFSNQGFTALQGVGGVVRFASPPYEMLSCAFAYAPGAGTAQTSFQKAARMLAFPNVTPEEVPDWVPRGVAAYSQFYWKMQEAFEYSGTLVDEFADEEGFFEDLLESIQKDPYGPQVDVRKELVAHLGERVILLRQVVVPVTPQSERLLVAIKVEDPAAVTATLEKALKNDPEARGVTVAGQTVWEIINQQSDENLNAPPVQVPGGFDPLGGEGFAEGEEPLFPNSAVTVAHGYLVWANRIDFLSEILTIPPVDKRLATSKDFARVRQALQQEGAGQVSFTRFTRTDKAVRAAYELLRQGKMPESESLFGRLLNELFATEDQKTREQQFRGEQLPDFERVRSYLGLSGGFVRTEENGWTVVSLFLPGSGEGDEDGEEPSLTTAAAPREP